MKKKISLIILILLFKINTAYAEEIIIYKGYAYNYIEILKTLNKTEFIIKYDTERDFYYLFTSDFLQKSWIKLSNYQLDKLRLTLEKYLDWEKKAIDNKLKLEKEFPNSELNCNISWLQTKEWFDSSRAIIKFTFFSQTKLRHQFIISSNNVSAASNKYVDWQLENLYLDKIHVTSFLKGISPESIKKAKLKNTKNKKTEELFQ